MKPDRTWLRGLALMLALPSLAMATDAYVIANVSLRAGPDIAYPRIEVLPAGAWVDIQGCTDGWGWCDVVYGNQRGWVAGNYIEYQYNQQPVLVPNYGAQIGIPIISFIIGAYWGSHYADRPFYRERERWYQRPIPRRPPPPPPRHRWHPSDGRYPPLRREPTHRGPSTPAFRRPSPTQVRPVLAPPSRPATRPASPQPPVQRREEQRQREHVQTRQTPARTQTRSTARPQAGSRSQPQRSTGDMRDRGREGRPADKKVKKEKESQGH